MHLSLTLQALVVLLPHTFAAPSPSPINPICTDFKAPITITAPFFPYLPPPFKTGYDATAFLLNLASRVPPSGSPLGPPVNQTKTYSINARYCTPSQDAGKKTIQVLTHGLGFDQSYWHFPGSNGSKEYDYAFAAAQAGYATLSYDRLGNGASQIVDPYHEQQAPVELAILALLTTQLKTGKLNKAIPTPTKIVHVGHSFGSLLSAALAATHPSLSDGLVLTGYSTDPSFQPRFLISTNFHLARENQPSRFGNRSTGALTWADKYSNQFGFGAWPYFDAEVWERAEAGKFPFSLGEIVTGHGWVDSWCCACVR